MNPHNDASSGLCGLDVSRSPRCTPETLEAFTHKLVHAIYSPATNAEVASVIFSDEWFQAMLNICSYQRLRARKSRWTCEDRQELMAETLYFLGLRCERRRAHGYDPDHRSNTSGFWRTVIGHAVTDALESVDRQVPPPLPSEIPAREDNNMNDRQTQVRDAISRLTARQQTIMLLRLEDLTLEQIAIRLGFSKKTVERSYQEACEELRQLLDD